MKRSQSGVVPRPVLDNTEIVVVGAGLAGLSAADTLVNIYGFKKVQIIEGTNKVGGRIRSVNFRTQQAGNGVLELGAEWISGLRFNPLYHLALGLNALEVKTRDHPNDFDLDAVLFTSNGCRLQGPFSSRLLKMWHWLSYATENLAQKSVNGSTSVADLLSEVEGSYLAENHLAEDEKLSYFTALIDIFKIHSALKIGANFLDTVSPRALLYARDKPYDWRIPLGSQGFRPILAYYMRRIGYHRIIMQSTVELVDYQLNLKPFDSQGSDTQKMHLILTNGRQIQADHIIMTPSLGYLKQNAAFMFRPPLPLDKLNFINKMGFGIVDKLYLIYEKSFWSEKINHIDLLRVQNDDWSCSLGGKKPMTSALEEIFWRFEVHRHFSNVLSVAMVNGTDPAIFELASTHDLAMAATSVLRKFSDYADIPMPSDVIKSNWGLDQHFFGSHPYLTVECANDPQCTAENFARPVEAMRNDMKTPAIFFAGDALGTDLHYASQAAVISGRSQAESIYRFYSNSK